MMKLKLKVPPHRNDPYIDYVIYLFKQKRIECREWRWRISKRDYSENPDNWDMYTRPVLREAIDRAKQSVSDATKKHRDEMMAV